MPSAFDPGPPLPGQKGHWCSETVSTLGSSRNNASVPFPWWTSKSTTATRSRPSSRCAWRAAMAALPKMQNPIAALFERVMAGRSHESEPSELDRANRAARGETRRSARARNGVRVGIEPPLRGDRLDAVDVAA